MGVKLPRGPGHHGLSSVRTCERLDPVAKRSKMAAFRTVPERLLRPVARALSARNSEFLTSKATLGRPRMYRAALCKELGKPLVVEQVPAIEKLKASQVTADMA